MVSFSFCKITFIELAEKCTWKNRQSTNKAFESNWRNVVQQSSNRGCLDSMRPSYNECRSWWKYNSRVRYVWGKTSSIFISWIYYYLNSGARIWITNTITSFQATVELHGAHTRGQLVLEKRSKSLKSSNNSKTKGSNEASAHSGIIHVVLEVDVEKLKNFMINGLS